MKIDEMHKMGLQVLKDLGSLDMKSELDALRIVRVADAMAEVMEHLRVAKAATKQTDAELLEICEKMDVTPDKLGQLIMIARLEGFKDEDGNV